MNRQILDVVTLLTDLPDAHLHAGQRGTVVELLDAATVLIEFADEQGRSLATVPVHVALLRQA